jgi:hypothetical protein
MPDGADDECAQRRAKSSVAKRANLFLATLVKASSISIRVTSPPDFCYMFALDFPVLRLISRTLLAKLGSVPQRRRAG